MSNPERQRRIPDAVIELHVRDDNRIEFKPALVTEENAQLVIHVLAEVMEILYLEVTKRIAAREAEPAEDNHQRPNPDAN